MANLTPKTINELPAAENLTGAELFAIADGITTKKTTFDLIRASSRLRGVAISSGENLNNFTTPGDYYIANAATAVTISNNPYTTGNSRLIVLQGGSTDYAVQILIATGTQNENVYLRNYDGNGFGPWIRLIHNKDALIYQPGTYTITYIPSYGWLTSDAKTVELFVPLPKSLAYISSCTISALTAALRTASGGYLVSSGVDLTADVTTISLSRGQGLDIVATRSSGYGGTNNTPLSGWVSVTFTLT